RGGSSLPRWVSLCPHGLNAARSPKVSQRWGLVAVRDPEEAPRIPEVLPSLYVPSDTAANGPSRSPGATATCTPPWSMRDSSPRTIASWPAAPLNFEYLSHLLPLPILNHGSTRVS